MSTKKVFLFILTLLSCLFASAQKKNAVDSLNHCYVIYGTHYDSVINRVLDAYSPLNKQQIVFKEKNLKTTMATRPQMDFIFRKKKDRIYRIFIDTLVEDSNGLLLKFLPYDALVGILAHEFAHIVDYEMRTNRGIISLGLNYSRLQGKVEIENRVDSITMEFGFADESIAFAEFLAETGLVSEEYKAFKSKIYNSVQDLKAMKRRIKERKRKAQRKEERKEKRQQRIQKREEKGLNR